MKYLLLPLILLPIWLFGPFGSSPENPAPASAPKIVNEATHATLVDMPVVLELFTSQGCSSCPSADRVLTELAGEDDVIALSFHVDYWNYLGWKDPFSSPHYSARQRDYTDELRARTYTPQLVINGRNELVGSRLGEVRALVVAARKTQSAHAPTINIVDGPAGKVQLGYTLAGSLKGLRVSAALVQNEATSSIKRGENRGRELHHVNVVRALDHQAARAAGSFSLDLPAGLSPNDCQVVLLVQKSDSQAIVGAARARLSAK